MNNHQILITAGLLYAAYFASGLAVSWAWWPEITEYVKPEQKKFNHIDAGYICMFSAVAGPFLWIIYKESVVAFGFHGKDSMDKY